MLSSKVVAGVASGLAVTAVGLIFDKWWISAAAGLLFLLAAGLWLTERKQKKMSDDHRKRTAGIKVNEGGVLGRIKDVTIIGFDSGIHNSGYIGEVTKSHIRDRKRRLGD